MAALFCLLVGAVSAAEPPRLHADPFECRPALQAGRVTEVLRCLTNDAADLAAVSQSCRAWLPRARPWLVGHAPRLVVVDANQIDGLPPRFFAVEQGGYGHAVTRVFGALPDCAAEVRVTGD